MRPLDVLAPLYVGGVVGVVQAVGVYSYAWELEGGRKLAALLGFRALGTNYSSGSGLNAVGINEVLYGPVIGVSYRF